MAAFNNLFSFSVSLDIGLSLKRRQEKRNIKVIVTRRNESVPSVRKDLQFKSKDMLPAEFHFNHQSEELSISQQICANFPFFATHSNTERLKQSP